MSHFIKQVVICDWLLSIQCCFFRYGKKVNIQMHERMSIQLCLSQAFALQSGVMCTSVLCTCALLVVLLESWMKIELKKELYLNIFFKPNM